MFKRLNKIRNFFSIERILISWQRRLSSIYSAWLATKKTLGLDVNFKDGIKSNTKIDVVIPAIERDYDTLCQVIDSIKKYIMHPIGKIYIISPSNSARIKKMCESKHCEFVDENTVLPLTKKDIVYNPTDEHFPEGVDRSGWVFQQLLKWGADKICEQEYFLITESDTIFIRPRIFEFHGKIIIPNNTDPCHLPYLKMYQRLLGEKANPIYYFTSHHSLFQKKVLTKLKKDIEDHCGDKWFNSIIKNLDPGEVSSVSDYETYGQYLVRHFRKKVIIEHWYNLSLSRKYLSDIDKLASEYAQKYKTISFHSYME